MRIRRIKLRDYGGVEEGEVTFPDTGITIIEGVNEAGKTTFIEAVDAILKFQDSSSHRKVKAAVPVGRDVGPEAEVDIVAGAYEFTYRKRWVRDRETVLEIAKPSHEQLTGREAHDRVREILEETVDLELWQALRLDQGTALGQADFEVSALGRALDAAAGGDVAGDREDALWNRIESEYAEYWTAGGKPRGDLREAKAELRAAQEKSEEARSHLRQLDEDAEEIHRLEIAAKDLQQVQKEAVDEARQIAEQVAAVGKIRQAIEHAEAEFDRAEAVHSKAQGDRQRRDELTEALGDASDEMDRVTDEVNRSIPEREILAQEAAATRGVYDAARASWEQAQEAHSLARMDSEYRRQQIEIDQLTERRDRVDEAQKQLERADKLIDSIKVDDDLLVDIEGAHLDVAKMRSAADRALPTVAIEALNDLQIGIDQEDVRMGTGTIRSVTVHESVDVVVPDEVKVTIRVGADSANLAADLERAEARYEELCSRGNVSDFSEAREQADQRLAALRDRADATETIERDLRDLTLEALSGKIGRLVRRTADFERSRGAEPPIPTDLTAAQDIERAAEQAVADARSASERAEEVSREAAENLARFDVDDARLKAQFEIAQSAVESARRALDAARSVESDSNLVAAEDAARADLEAAETAVSDARAQLAAADPDTLEALLANAEAAELRSVEDFQANEDRRRELQIKLAIETERGPARDADEAETNLIEAEVRYERLSSRGEAARLLYETFSKRRQEARRRYTRPFGDQIERLGRIVFGPTFEVALDDDLSIKTRTVEGTTLDFGQLSTGTQEQLGLLARLACAKLVAPDGGAPVIFDDALGWTDPGRLDRMGAAISTVADDCQVIILTCVPNRYSGVGKARVVTV